MSKLLRVVFNHYCLVVGFNVHVKLLDRLRKKFQFLISSSSPNHLGVGG